MGRPAVVMLIAAYLPTAEGGAERQCRRLSAELSKRGHRVRVVTIRRTYTAPRAEISEGVEVVRLGIFGPLFAFLLRVKDRLRSRRAVRMAAAPLNQTAPSTKAHYWHPTVVLLRLDRLLFMAAATVYLMRIRREIRLIHCHESHWLAGFAGWIGLRLGRPVLVKEATYPVLLPLSTDCPWRTRLQTARLSAHFVAQTTVARDAMRSAGIDTARITVVANGVELPPDTADLHRNREVLFIGHMFDPYIKALDVLFAAWVRVVGRNPSARLLIVGGGDQEPWRNLLAQDGAAATVEFVGAVPDPTPYYRRAAFLVLPSRHEGLSNVLLEAQSWGVPAVVSEIPGNLAMIEHGVNGIVVPVGDSVTLASAILELLANPARRLSLGQAARLRAAAQPGFATFADRIIEVYRRLQPCTPGER